MSVLLIIPFLEENGKYLINHLSENIENTPLLVQIFILHVCIKSSNCLNFNTKQLK